MPRKWSKFKSMQRVALFVPKAGPTDGKSFYLENSALDTSPLGINFDEISCIRESVLINVQVLSRSIIYTYSLMISYCRRFLEPRFVLR